MNKPTLGIIGGGQLGSLLAESDKGISTGSKGPPGMACIKTKTKTEIKKKVKTIDNSLFIIYLIIYTTSASTK